MPITGPDLSSNQPWFDFGLAYRQGHRAVYVKLGGDNIPRYVSSSYAGRVDQARAAGFIVGHYWVTGGHDPVQAAQFFVRNLRNPGPTDFFVLDNEKLDNGNMYTDAEAAAWIQTVQALVGGDRKRVFMYASASPLGAQSWPATRATGAQALVAWYGKAPLSFAGIGSWPESQIGGHQYTSSGNAGGVSPVDMNVWKDGALTFSGAAAAPPRQEETMLVVFGDITGEKYKFLYDVWKDTRTPLLNARQVSLAGYANIPTIQMQQASLDAIPYAPKEDLSAVNVVDSVSSRVSAPDPAATAAALAPLLAIPTAEQNAQAARAAIVK